MSATHRRLRWILGLTASCLGLGVRVATAQAGAVPAPESKVLWEVGTGRGAWCIHFLVSPKDAAGLLLKGQSPVAATGVAELPAAIRRTIAEEPEYARWIPSQVCVWFADEVAANRRRYDRGDGGKPLALFWWGLASTGERFGGQPGLSQVVLATNSSGLKRQMELEFVEMERIDIDREPVKESEDEETRFRLDRTIVSFAGHPRSDSSLVLRPLAFRSVVRGESNRIWTVRFSAQPTGVAALAGSLRIQGKGDLARTLTSSPIRLVGSIHSGGPAEFRFSE